MGWLDSIFGSRTDDPLGSLDPEVKEFLKREAPVRHVDQTPKQAPPSASGNGDDATAESSAPKVPRESLFPDGRYAHLWKTYTPLVEIEASTKSDSQKIVDIVEAFKERKKEIQRAAMQNCAEVQEEWRTCHEQGTWWDRSTGCTAMLRKFERCYDTNTRLLKALGYQAAFDRAPEIEEEIQMHADALYQRILAHEAAVEQATAAGQPVPVFDPSVAIRSEQAKLAALRREATTAAAREAATLDDPIEPNQKVRADWDRKLAELPEEDRPAEEAALQADLESRVKLARAAEAIWDASKKKRTGERQKSDEEKKAEETTRAGTSSQNLPPRDMWQHLKEWLRYGGH